MIYCSSLSAAALNKLKKSGILKGGKITPKSWGLISPRKPWYMWINQMLVSTKIRRKTSLMNRVAVYGEIPELNDDRLMGAIWKLRVLSERMTSKSLSKRIMAPAWTGRSVIYWPEIEPHLRSGWTGVDVGIVVACLAPSWTSRRNRSKSKIMNVSVACSGPFQRAEQERHIDGSAWKQLIKTLMAQVSCDIWPDSLLSRLRSLTTHLLFNILSLLPCPSMSPFLSS